MVMKTITKVVATLGASDIDKQLEMRLVDGTIYSFQEQTTEDKVISVLEREAEQHGTDQTSVLKE